MIAGGSAYAGSKLARNSVKAKHIAKNAVTNKHTRQMTVAAPKNVKAFEGIAADAPRIPLLRRGPFSLYAKCYAPGPGASAQIYLSNRANGVIGMLNGSIYTGHGGNNYIGKSDAIPFTPITTPADQAVFDSKSVSLVHGKKSFRASVEVYVKGGALPAGNGTYGPGKRCIFIANESGTG